MRFISAVGVLSLMACSAGFHGVAKRAEGQQNSTGASEVPATEAASERGLGELEEVDDNVIADEPVMTNGSFLTCSSAPKGNDPVGFTAIDCNVMTNESEVARTSAGVTASIKIFNDLNYEVAGKYERTPDETLTWRVIAATSDLTGARVELTLIHNASGAVRSKLSNIQGTEQTGGSARLRELEGPFHLGDDKNGAKDCRKDQGEPRLFGREIKHKFIVNSDGTVLGINLLGLCDVSSGSNRIVVSNDDGDEVIVAEVRKGSKDQLIPGRQLNAGEYTLRVSSAKQGILKANLDDFFIKRIELVASGELKLERD